MHLHQVRTFLHLSLQSMCISVIFRSMKSDVARRKEEVQEKRKNFRFLQNFANYRVALNHHLTYFRFTIDDESEFFQHDLTKQAEADLEDAEIVWTKKKYINSLSAKICSTLFLNRNRPVELWTMTADEFFRQDNI